ncbi:MAG: ATP-binding cassette domain-containing protein [Cytophagales bacterium]
MRLTLKNISKKFASQMLYENLNKTLHSGQSWAITGKNGSGKSTLLQIIAGTAQPSKGEVTYEQHQKTIPPDFWYRHLSIVAPYVNLLEELTVTEFLNIHFALKPMLGTKDEFLTSCHLQDHKNKMLKYFSSGMKQRLKLNLAFRSKSELILLDEPTSNLDKKFTQWYLDEIKTLNERKEKILIVFSNLEEEFSWCEEILDLSFNNKS